MNGEIRPLVQMEHLSLRIYRFKFKTLRKLPMILDKAIEYTISNQERNTEGWQNVTGWTWKLLELNRFRQKPSRTLNSRTFPGVNSETVRNPVSAIFIHRDLLSSIDLTYLYIAQKPSWKFTTSVQYVGLLVDGISTIVLDINKEVMNLIRVPALNNSELNTKLFKSRYRTSLTSWDYSNLICGKVRWPQPQ